MMKQNASKIFKIAMVVFALLIALYACIAAISGWNYVSNLLEQGQLDIKENLFNIVTYFMQTVGVYLVYALLIFLGVQNSRNITELKAQNQVNGMAVDSVGLMETLPDTKIDIEDEENIEGFLLMNGDEENKEADR
jgi:hypothetical protein